MMVRPKTNAVLVEDIMGLKGEERASSQPITTRRPRSKTWRIT